MRYVYVNSISKETDKPTERGLYRSGESVELCNLGVDRSLLIRYEDNTATVTSTVETIEHSGKLLAIETLNTLYTFSELGD